MVENILLSDLECLNPLNYKIWDGLDRPITKEEVLFCIKNRKFIRKTFSPKTKWCRQQHIKRIAYLVVYGWQEPIVIYYHPMRMLLMDGNHRLAAAFIKNDTSILVKNY